MFTSATTPSATLAELFTGNDIPKKLLYVARNLFQLNPIANEPPIFKTIRRIIEAIGSTLYLINPLIMLFGVCFRAKVFSFGRPSTCYRIGDANIQLTPEFFERALHRLSNRQFYYPKLEIIQGAAYPALTPSSAMIEYLQRLKPKQLRLWNISFVETILAGLETPNHHYIISTTTETSVLYHQITRRNKISEVMLPSDGEAAIDVLQRLVDEQQRVHRLYYTAYMPERDEQRIADLVGMINPDIECRILTDQNISTDAIDTLA